MCSHINNVGNFILGMVEVAIDIYLFLQEWFSLRRERTFPRRLFTIEYFI